MKQTFLQQISTSQPTLMHEISMLRPPSMKTNVMTAFVCLVGTQMAFTINPMVWIVLE